ncbi:sterol desaturase family protein [uncultured Roseobacter sp.]|uniref:sterol desaturase family protein n=1 Tax=uncultured Roseobacter sp. TaxID=114847 RepID=UPI0026041C49|nr:sterol desaturase family protein [uncultured Roseobacter sp.]
MDTVLGYFRYLLNIFFNMNERFALFYICCTVLLAFAVWCWRGRPGSFLTWLVPAKIYLHRSNLLDIKLFLAVRCIAFFGVLGSLFFPTAVAYFVLSWLSESFSGGFSQPPVTWGRSLIATIVIVMASDFCKYWAHRLHHEWKVLWPFHAVHHSADVLTPLTVQRVHPIEPIIRNLFISVLVGIVQGVLLYALIGKIDLVTLGGANAMYVVFNALGANLRHSHIWLSYGRVMEHIFISPAQHQVHHSVALEHHDKNYGSMFAIWDWMFGTLYVPEKMEHITYGVSDGTGKPVPQPYVTLRDAMIKPFIEAWQAFRQQQSERAARRAAMPPVVMSQGFSIWLDFLRAAAALAVLFGHMAHIRFTRGDYYILREINIASDSVIVFFVLSGVVISYAATRDGTLERFAFNRLTRLWSVVLPALVLTVIFDTIGTGIRMEAYPAGYYNPAPVSEMFLRGLTFTNEWQGQWDRVRLGTNGPLWSLSYEVGFYIMFGVAFFLRGVLRWVLLALLVLLVGLPILALLPAWLMGVLVWHGSRRPAEDTALPARDWARAVLSVGALILLRLNGVPELLSEFTAQALAPVSHHKLLNYSDEVLWNSIIAAFVALHLSGVKNIADRMTIRSEGCSVQTIRWIAGASFSLYVMHYPTLHLLDATLPETLPGYDLWLLGLTLLVCFVFAALFERPLKIFRRLAHPVWRRAATPFARVPAAPV